MKQAQTKGWTEAITMSSEEQDEEKLNEESPFQDRYKDVGMALRRESVSRIINDIMDKKAGAISDALISFDEITDQLKKQTNDFSKIKKNFGKEPVKSTIKQLSSIEHQFSNLHKQLISFIKQLGR